MPRVSIRIPWSYRTFLFLFILLSWTTGIAFYILNNFIEMEGEFGPQKHPWQYPLLKIHGASAFLMMITYGYLLATHIPAGWKAKRSRKAGLLLVATQGFLIVTAYLLYYAGWEEEVRKYLVWTHASVGFTFPFLVALHIVSGRRRT
tara:strand:- start:4557 stop:4997 length:441 start_codon:yes stop_codon:yes gene_type:complete